MAKIIKPLVGRSPHHVQNNKDFLESIRNIKLQPDECIMSYDVSALFTSIPIDPAIKIIQKHIEDDKDLSNRTSLTVNHIICLLEFCLRNTCFSFQGRYYEQTEGDAMGSPISPLVANLFMEEIEVQAIRASTTPPTLWKRFVDDTFTIIKKNNRDSFLQHLNSIHPKIKFTCEEVREDGSMPFLDILVTPEEDGSLKHQCSEKQLTLIYTYNGTATILFHLSTVWLVPNIIEYLQSAPTPNCCKKKKNTSWILSQYANTPHGPLKEQEWRARTQIGTEQEESKLARTTTKQTCTW